MTLNIIFPDFQIFKEKLNSFMENSVGNTDEHFYKFLINLFDERELLTDNEKNFIAQFYSKWKDLKTRLVKAISINETAVTDLIKTFSRTDIFRGNLEQESEEIQRFTDTGQSNLFTPALIDKLSQVLNLPSIYENIELIFRDLFFNVGVKNVDTPIPTPSRNHTINIKATEPNLENGDNQFEINKTNKNNLDELNIKTQNLTDNGKIDGDNVEITRGSLIGENVTNALTTLNTNINDNTNDISILNSKIFWISFTQINPTQQNLWDFLNSNQGDTGDLVNVNGKFYIILLKVAGGAGFYRLWRPQIHKDDEKYESESEFLIAENQGNSLIPQIVKNSVHGENVFLHDPYGSQGAHNDLPLQNFIRYWDGTLDDLSNPNLWQSIFSWPAENINDYSGTYQVFTKNSWKLDRNRINRILYEYDTAANTDSITYKLPIKTTKTTNFNDDELIPQSEIKNLISGGGGGLTPEQIALLNRTKYYTQIVKPPGEPTFLNLKMSSNNAGTSYVTQGAFSILNEKVYFLYGGEIKFIITGEIQYNNGYTISNGNFIFPFLSFKFTGQNLSFKQRAFGAKAEFYLAGLRPTRWDLEKKSTKYFLTYRNKTYYNPTTKVHLLQPNFSTFTSDEWIYRRYTDFPQKFSMEITLIPLNVDGTYYYHVANQYWNV